MKPELKKSRWRQGIYTPRNPEKYAGDSTRIIYRSSWERKVMLWLDFSKKITRWASEEIIIPYINPVDGEIHRYYPDFWFITVEGRKFIVEVKPSSQVKRPRKTDIKGIEEWVKNMSKWKAASEFCLKTGAEFKVLTEKELFL